MPETSAAQQLLAMTRQMLQFAESGEWDALAEAEIVRKPLLQAAFEAPLNDKQTLEAVTREVAELDQRILQCARDGMVELKQGLKAIQTGKQASLAYQSHE